MYILKSGVSGNWQPLALGLSTRANSLNIANTLDIYILRKSGYRNHKPVESNYRDSGTFAALAGEPGVARCLSLQDNLGPFG